ASAVLTTVLVEEQGTGLKEDLLVTPVEIAEGDEVAQQLDEVAVVARQALERVDLFGSGFGSQILLDEGLEPGAYAARQQRAQFGDVHRGERVGGSRADPCPIGGKA